MYHGRIHGPERGDSAVGARRRLPSALQAPARSRPSARKHQGGDDRRRADDWENLYLAAGSPERVLLVDFKNEKLKPLTGKTLAEVAKLRGTDPFDTILDLVLEDESRVGAVYFLMSEDNIKKQLRGPGSRSDRTRRRWRPRASSSSRQRIRAPTATSRGCSASTSATSTCMSLSKRRSAGCHEPAGRRISS